MTQNRGSKRAVRSRMTLTGEKYTDARRALLSSGGRGGGQTPDVASAWPDDPLGWFTDQAYNAILLAEDEARMLGQSVVEPVHLLLAIARSGNAQRLLADAGIDARAIHAAVVGISGFGDGLALGRLPRSPASEDVLRQAIAAAAARGTLGPSTEHLLLAVAAQPAAAAVLGELGLVDAPALVDAKYPVRRGPLDPATLERHAGQLAAHVRTPPSPGPMPPVFERFTTDAHDAVDAGVARARSLEDHYVQTAHLLFGLLHAGAGVAADVSARHGWLLDPAPAPTEPVGAPARRSTGIFSQAARRIVAEDVLEIAHRFAHRELSTGHLLLAILEHPDPSAAEVIKSLPDAPQVVTDLIAVLPGNEHT